MTRKIEGLLKSHHCGELRKEHIGQTVTLCGWVNKYRDLGGLHFVDVRDKYGLTQLSFEEFFEKGGKEEALKALSLESVILATGVVGARPDSAINKNMDTGEVEVRVHRLELLSSSDKDTLPFLPHGKVEATEDLRLKYRYLDLRSKHLQDIIQLRSDTTTTVRKTLTEVGFVEVETPILYKSTPEGARDYIVPSRVHPGKVYALPQSPQTLKQLLMIGNTDKYFQICRCFRDEDLRADRQPEFSQIDIEVSFATQEYIKNLAVEIIRPLFNLPADFKLQEMTYDEAMERYGSDKPDLRFGLEHKTVTDLFSKSDFKVFSSVSEAKGLIKALFVSEERGTFSRKDVDGLTDVVKPYGGKGVAFYKVEGDERSGGISKFITDEIHAEMKKSQDSSKGTWFFFADANHDRTHACADAVRRHFGRKLDLIEDGYKFLWVYDFPLLEWDEEEERHAARHHPFTSPKVDFIQKFMIGDKNTLSSLPAEAYDLVCNGYEIGGGSVRIHSQDVQKRMFEVLGMSEEEAKYQFGFFIEALNYGVPPHAGMAFGLDRLIMLLAKTDSIRDVIAFPKTNAATDLMAGAPSVPAPGLLKELKMDFTKNKE